MEHIAVFCSASQDIDNITLIISMPKRHASLVPGWETTVKLWFTVVQVRV